MIWAKNQPEYLPLPSVVTEDGRVVSKWKLRLRERIMVLLCGVIYHEQLNFGGPLQPVKMGTERPDLDVFGADPTMLTKSEHQGIKAE